tara:strand:- start:818 stop:1042 length:225 start_codon:yes stop_codon:yes gene_type:complete
MTKYLKVESDPNLLRNTDSQAIINNNSNEFDQFMEASRRKYNEKKEIEILKSDVNTMKNDLDEIKSLLKTIVHK